jgi:uncharacterized DUF497 family protein
MDFEWDPAKAELNLTDHGVSFADTFAVFEDSSAITIDEPRQEEDRFITLGMDAFGRILVVVYTWRGDNIRIISARRANRTERRNYESGL